MRADDDPLFEFEDEWSDESRKHGSYLFKPWLRDNESDPIKYYSSSYWPYPDKNPLDITFGDFYQPKIWPKGYRCHTEALARAPRRCKQAGVADENIKECVRAQQGALRHQFSVYTYRDSKAGEVPIKKFRESLYDLTVDGPRGIMAFSETFGCGGLTRLLGGEGHGEHQRNACLSSIKASIHDAKACIKRKNP